MTRFALATQYAWQDATTKAKREAVDFHDVIAWGRLGDIVRQYVKKGSKLYVEGRLRKRHAVGKDGARRTTTEIVADNMIMLGLRSSSTRGTTPVNARLVREDVDVDEVGNRGGGVTSSPDTVRGGRTPDEARQRALISDDFEHLDGGVESVHVEDEQSTTEDYDSGG